MTDFNELMKQAQAVQEKLHQAQERLAQVVVEGSAGGGMVRLTLQGAGDLKSIDIDKTLLNGDEAEILADLIVAAHADARRKLTETHAQAMREAAGPLAGLPGLQF
jgi:DNA-binding YbaB/EbfC family protein